MNNGESDATAAGGATHSESDMVISRSQVQSTEEGNINNPVPKCWPKWRGKPVYAGNKEVVGWTLVTVAMLINYAGTGAFMVTTILRLAEKASTCHEVNAGSGVDLYELCGPRITLVKPSSLLTFYAMIVGVIAACILPFLGAMVDYTSNRLLLGRIAAAVVTIFLFPFIFLDKYNYIMILGCHGCSIFVGWFVTALYYAYLPELTTSELLLADWTKSITIWAHFGMLIYLAGVILVVRSLGRARDETFTSQLAMGIIFGINLLFLQVSWWLCFGKREALHKMPENSSLCTVGLKQLYDTGHHIRRNYRSLKWYLLHVNMANSSWQAFGIIALSYMTDVLKMNPLQSGTAIIVSLIGSFPGAVLGSFIARRFDPIKAAMFNIVLMIACIAGFTIVLTGPDQMIRTYIYFLFVGFNNGMKVNLDRLLAASMIPTGQETEMMGLWLFADQCLLWLPLLVYTIMNEADVAPRINIAVLNVYLCIALFYLCLTGSYADARAEVNRTSVFSSKGSQSLAITTQEVNGNDAAPVEGAKDDSLKDGEDGAGAQTEKNFAEA